MQATIFTEIEGEIKGIGVQDYTGELDVLLNDFYPTYDEVVTLIECGNCAYLGEYYDDSEFTIDDTGLGEFLNSYTIDDFLAEFGETFNFYFNPETDEWEQC
jgi:hypothetical protein